MKQNDTTQNVTMQKNTQPNGIHQNDINQNVTLQNNTQPNDIHQNDNQHYSINRTFKIEYI